MKIHIERHNGGHPIYLGYFEAGDASEVDIEAIADDPGGCGISDLADAYDWVGPEIDYGDRDLVYECVADSVGAP